MHSNSDNPTINKSTPTLRIAIDASIKATNSSIIDTDRHVIIAVHRDFVALHRCKVSVHRRKADRTSLRIRSLQWASILYRCIESLLRCEASLQINIVTSHRCEACLHRDSETDSSNFITSAIISVRKHRYIVTDPNCFVPDASDVGTDTSFFATKTLNTQRKRGCAVQPLHGSPSTINDNNN